MIYTDASGEDFGLSLIIAAAVAAFTSVATDYYLNRPVDFINMFQSIAMAAISAGVSNGIGDIFKAGRVKIYSELKENSKADLFDLMKKMEAACKNEILRYIELSGSKGQGNNFKNV